MKQKIKEEVRYDRKCDIGRSSEIGKISVIAEVVDIKRIVIIVDSL